FPPPDVIQLLQARGTASGDGLADLEDLVRGLYDESAPDVKRLDEERQIALAAIPGGESGEALATAIQQALPQTRVVLSDRCEEIVVLREQFLQGLGDLEQTGSLAQEAYRQRLSQDPTAVHARGDIPDWTPRGATV